MKELINKTNKAAILLKDVTETLINETNENINRLDDDEIKKELRSILSDAQKKGANKDELLLRLKKINNASK